MLFACVALVACGSAQAPRKAGGAGHKVLRAIYRDDHAIMLVALRDGGAALPRGDCAQPLLVDPGTGAAHPIDAAEAAARQRTMQLAGAVEGTCPGK
ncbi:MAG: hypothetical protein RIS94_2679 [Pseudomonadota bacterium]